MEAPGHLGQSSLWGSPRTESTKEAEGHQGLRMTSYRHCNIIAQAEAGRTVFIRKGRES